jgi:hypothetical protein
MYNVISIPAPTAVPHNMICEMSNPCEKNGKCVFNSDDEVECECDSEYLGDLCESKSCFFALS